MRGKKISSANRVCPVTLARASTRRRGTPITFIDLAPQSSPSPLPQLQKSADNQCTGTNSPKGPNESRRAWDAREKPATPSLSPKSPACNTRTAPPPNPQKHPATDAISHPLQV